MKQILLYINWEKSQCLESLLILSSDKEFNIKIGTTDSQSIPFPFQSKLGFAINFTDFFGILKGLFQYLQKSIDFGFDRDI